VNEELLRKAKEESKMVMAERNKEIEESRRFYRKLRLEEKQKKRLFSQEVCSEVFDLIFDIANEAFMKEGRKKRLEKAEWREWMRIFKNNKFVSAVMHAGPASPHENLQDTPEEEEAIPECQQDLLEYICQTGQFNLRIDPIWMDMKKVIEKFGLNYQLLDSILPPMNIELGRLVSNIMRLPSSDSSIDSAGKEENKRKGKDYPDFVPLKLCFLGRIFSGKRTAAQKLKEKLGGNVKVFRMQEVIKEALDYINPKQAEAPPPAKGGKKGPAKGEEKPVDIFEGFDTTTYKEAAGQIKEKLGEEFSSIPLQELIPKVDDDRLVVSLFVERLKFAFPQRPSEEEIESEMRTQIQRERELES